MSEINSQWIRTKQLQSQKFKYRVSEPCWGTALSQIWENAKGQWKNKESVRKWRWGRQRARETGGTCLHSTAYLLPFSFLSIFSKIKKTQSAHSLLTTSYPEWGRQLGRVCADPALWLCVPVLRDVSSIWPRHAATCMPASQFRGDTLPSSPFNTAPAASIDLFSPAIGPQSCTATPIGAVGRVYVNKNAGGVQEGEAGARRNVNKWPLRDTTLMLARARAKEPQWGPWLSRTRPCTVTSGFWGGADD